MTFSKKTDHSNPLFSRLEFLKVDDIHQFQLLAFVYDCQNRLAPAQFHDFFIPCAQIHSFNTRLAARSDLFLERKNTFQCRTMEHAPNSAEGILFTFCFSY